MKLRILLIFFTLLSPLQHVYADDLGACFNALKYDRELQTISDKVPLARVDEVTFSMLANENRPTSDETQAIYKWATKREQCFKSYPPPNNPVTQIVNDGFNAIQSLILDLYKSAITYGEFSKQCQETMNMVVARIQVITGQQQRIQISQPIQQPQPTRDPLYNPYSKPPPVTTRCRWDVLMQETVCETR